MTYVEGFVCAVPTANRDEYLAHAKSAAEMIIANGATRMVETWADDVPEGKVTDFAKSVQAKEDESVVFSWFEYPDKATRDAANEKMMADPRMEEMSKSMPFDGSRMIYAGFRGINEAGPAGAMGYVDAMIAPVEGNKEAAYEGWCGKVADVFVEHGATRVMDTLGDDVPDGKQTDFKRAVQRQDGENVAYGWVEWPSKDVRDAAWGKLMEDERLSQPGEIGMDGKRLFFGGFTPILDTAAE